MRSLNLVRWTTALALTVPFVASTPAQTKPQTATQFYMEYRAAFDKATKVEDIASYMAAKNRKQMEDTPKADREKMFGLIKIMGAITEVKVTKEEHTPDGGAILTVEALDSDKKKAAGKITIIKEGGAWKIGEEEWKS